MVGKSTNKQTKNTACINKQLNKSRWGSKTPKASLSEIEKEDLRDKTGKDVSQAHAC